MRLRTSQVTYELRDLAGEPEIQKVLKSDDENYDIERIVKTTKRNGKIQLVLWKGYPSKFDSWVDEHAAK